MAKYCEIESLKATIREAYKGKNEFMGDAICSLIDKNAVDEIVKIVPVYSTGYECYGGKGSYCGYEKPLPQGGNGGKWDMKRGDIR